MEKSTCGPEAYTLSYLVLVDPCSKPKETLHAPCHMVGSSHEAHCNRIWKAWSQTLKPWSQPRMLNLGNPITSYTLRLRFPPLPSLLPSFTASSLLSFPC